MSVAARAQLLKHSPSVRVTSRGSLDIKGKGKMECFFLDTEEEALKALADVPYAESAAVGSKYATTKSSDDTGSNPENDVAAAYLPMDTIV